MKLYKLAICALVVGSQPPEGRSSHVKLDSSTKGQHTKRPAQLKATSVFITSPQTCLSISKFICAGYRGHIGSNVLLCFATTLILTVEEFLEPVVRNATTKNIRIATIRSPLYAIEEILSMERGWMLQLQVSMISFQLRHPAPRTEGTEFIQL